MLDDGEGRVDFAETDGGEGVGFVDVGGYVAIGTLGIWDKGRDELLVAGLAEVEGLLAVWV